MAGVFKFHQHRFDRESGRLDLTYSLDDIRLCETLSFPVPVTALSAQRAAALDRLFRLLHLVAGVSYYKARCPERIEASGLSPAMAAFLNDLYLQGLGEFAYRNGLDLRQRIHFEPDASPGEPVTVSLPRSSLVALGGGKDSLVSIEMLRAAGEQPVLFSLGSAPLIVEVARATGLEHLRVTRRLAPELKALNAAGAYNGHVPVTAIVSLVALCCAVLHGHDRVVMSNERSADSGNLTLPGGFVVNHQFSKSFAFERDLARLLNDEFVQGLSCFSLLRPLTEAGVAARFARLGRYHRVFSSCNRNFHIDGPRGSERWCRDCPKCRFVFLSLAPFLSRESLLEIFGGDLLADQGQIPGFAALLGIGAHKPFECVGEEDESRALMSALAANPDWRDSSVIRALGDRLSAAPPLESLLGPRGEHQVPADLIPLLDEPV